MDISYKHQIDQRPRITNLYHKQPFQTSPISTNEQTSELLPTAISKNANKQLEPIVLYTHINKEQRPKIQYVIKTAHKHIRKCLMHFNMIPGIIGHYQFYTQDNLSLCETNLIKTRTALLQPLLRDQVFHQELNQNNGIFCRHHSYGKQTFTFLLLHMIRYDL